MPSIRNLQKPMQFVPREWKLKENLFMKKIDVLKLFFQKKKIILCPDVKYDDMLSVKLEKKVN